MRNGLMTVLAVLTSLTPGVLRAVDYDLPLGETDTISTNVTYATMTIAGDLTVNADAAVKPKTVQLAGGTVTVDGKTTLFGLGTDAGQMTLNITNDAHGVYGKVIVRNGTAAAFNYNYNVGARTLNVCTNVAGVTGTGGCIDFLDMQGGGVQAYNAYNYSTLTARVTVTGNSLLTKISGYSEKGMFRQGKFLIDLKSGSALTFNVGNQLGSFNEDGVVVRTVGTGSVTFGQDFNSYGDYPIHIRKGAYFNHAGELCFNGGGSVSTGGGGVMIDGDDLVGPNVTRIRSVTDNRCLRISQNACLTVPDVDLSSKGSMIVGNGRVVLDCATAPHVFKANSPKTYSLYYSSASHAFTNNLLIVKTGAHESTVTSTNLVSVWVREGTMRFVGSDCTLGNVRVDEGGEVIVDGCTLTLDWAGGAMISPRITTVNGGKVVCSVEGDAWLCSPALNGFVQVKGGDVVCSTVAGCDKKYWRFTARGMHGNPMPFYIRNLFLFGKNHVIQNWGLGYATPATEATATALETGKARWLCNSSTNILATGIVYWQDIDDLQQIFKVSNNGNNYARLTAPVVDADNPASWPTIEMHLSDTAQPITGYAITTVIENGNFCSHWDVYASDDGVEWVKMDSRDGEMPRVLNNGYYTFDGYEYSSMLQNKTKAEIEDKLVETFILGEYVQGGLSAVAPIQVQIDAEASFDLRAYTESVQTVDALTVDVATGGGRLIGGALAAKGEIHLLNIDFDAPKAIPIEFEETDGTANLPNWKVFNGAVEMPGSVIAYNAELKQLELESTLIHITESGESDLQGAYPGKDLVILIDSGVSFTNTAAFTGSKAISVTGAGTLVSTVESPDYTGPIALGGGTLRGMVSNAFGVGTITIEGSTTADCGIWYGSETVATAYDNDIIVKHGTSIAHPAIRIITSAQKAVVFNGSISSSGYLAMVDSGVGNSQGYTIVTFNGPVAAPGQTVEYSTDNQTQWYGTLTVGCLKARSIYPSMGTHHLYSSDNSIGRLHFYYTGCRARAENAFGGADLHGEYGNNEEGRGPFDLYGYSQTIACLSWEGNGINTKVVKNTRNAAVTLTITGGVAVACTPYRMLAGDNDAKRISVTVDAGNDDFVQEFTNSYWTTFGDVTVKNGTLRFTGTTSATNVPSLLVEKGAFEIDSTQANALRGVTNLVLGAEARLRVSARTVEPFGAANSEVALQMAETSTLELPEGAAMTVKKAWIGDCPVSAGTYTGVEGTGASVREQIFGAGRLTVLSGGGLVIIFR